MEEYPRGSHSPILMSKVNNYFTLKLKFDIIKKVMTPLIYSYNITPLLDLSERKENN